MMHNDNDTLFDVCTLPPEETLERLTSAFGDSPTSREPSSKLEGD